LTVVRRAFLAGVALALIATPAPAQAYTHTQVCYKYPYDQCYDVQGKIYNPWAGSRTSTVPSRFPDYTSGTCAKAVTQAGTTKGGSACGSTTSTFAFYQPYPESQAYGYYGWSGHSGYLQRMEVVATT